jgi:ElaB/YqjD/DUF883 family membrane-anchored ribosome-binding protein
MHTNPSGQHNPSAQEVKDKAQEAGTAVVDKAKEMAGAAVDKTKEMAGAAADKAREFASAAGHKAEDAKSAVGSGIQSLAHTIESGGRYLQEEDFKSIAEDLANLIRRNPVPAMVVGIGLGFILARALRS